MNAAPRGRVLMVVRPSKGGAFGHALRISRALAERGYECAICGPHQHLAAQIEPQVHPLEIPRRPHLGKHPAAVAALGSIYRSFRPDVIHAHGSQGGVIARLARIARPRTPLVFTPHNYAFTNYFTSRLERGAYRAIEIAMAPLATRVLCVCEAERRMASRVGPRRRTRVVYNGIDPLPSVPADPFVARLAEGGPLVCAVAELQPPKGVTTLVAAMPQVVERWPEANLLVAGEGIERPALERQVSELGLGARAHLPGSLGNVAGLLEAADLFVQPGWSESFPYSILEAMGAGIPIVATDVGGIGEAIEDGVTGRLVRARDPSALAAGIADLLSDPARAKALGASARERMIARFNFEQMVEGTLAVYREVGLP